MISSSIFRTLGQSLELSERLNEERSGELGYAVRMGCKGKQAGRLSKDINCTAAVATSCRKQSQNHKLQDHLFKSDLMGKPSELHFLCTEEIVE